MYSVPGQRFLLTLAGAEGHSNWVRTAAFSPDGRLVLSGSDDKTIKLWDVATHRCTHTFEDHSSG